MAYINPFIKVNAGGIPRLEAVGADSSNGLLYSFRPHRFLDYPYAGLLIFKLPAVTSTLTEGNVYFTSDGGNSKVQVFNSHNKPVAGDNAKLALGGIFIGWYADGVLQILNGLT